MCFPKQEKPKMPAERQVTQEPKDQAVAAADRTKDRLRAGSNTILTGPGGVSNAPILKGNVLGR